jgi:hypothetical protein
MRDSFEAFFKNQYSYKSRWDYFCVPGHYTYLRAEPQAILSEAVFSGFVQRLRQWCLDTLGLVPMGTPFLHLMVNGCKLELHSDFHNGTWGYVYSLTQWSERKFSGGETLLMRDGVPSYKRHHVQGEVLYELIPAEFNQLLIFDDRIVHGTPTIEGSMNPLEARVALGGHLRTTSPYTRGSLSGASVRPAIIEALKDIAKRIKEFRDVFGTATYTLCVKQSGTVDSIDVLTDNIVTPSVGYGRSDSAEAVRSVIQQSLKQILFHSSSGLTTIVVPVQVPIPDLTPIELSIPHSLSGEALRTLKERIDLSIAPSSIRGTWENEAMLINEPIAGHILLKAQSIEACFDAPMWVPSQREKFHSDLRDALQSVL